MRSDGTRLRSDLEAGVIRYILESATDHFKGVLVVFSKSRNESWGFLEVFSKLNNELGYSRNCLKTRTCIYRFQSEVKVNYIKILGMKLTIRLCNTKMLVIQPYFWNRFEHGIFH